MKFQLEFDDLFARFGLKDHLGCTIIETRQIFIDESLDPVEHPEREGQLNFTIAHEVGHIKLHQGIPCPHLLPADEKPWLERQANWFASSLLMPRGLVYKVWRARFGESPLVITPDMEEIGIANLGSRAKLLSYLADKRAGELAPLFTVSREAMRIQLQDFGLLPRW